MSYGVTIVRRCATAALGVIAILGGLVVSVGGMTTPVSALAGINETINFQGRLFNAQGAVVADGYYNIQFKIYQDGDGQTVGNTTGSPAGSLKWTESYLNSASKGVLVKNGYMSVELGSITAFANNIDWNQNTLWLSMNIGSTNASCVSFATCSPDGEMTPMKRLSSTPYALNAGRLGNMTSGQFVQLAQGVQTDAIVASNSIFINKTGAGGNFINFQQSGATAISIADTGDLTFGSNADHNISVAAAAASTSGKKLTFSAGAGGSGLGSNGGDLVMQGGAAGGTNANGGNIVINGGAKAGTGVNGMVSVGTSNTSAINLNQNTTIAAGKSLTITGGATATRPTNPAEGTLYFDSTTKTLLTYANGNWQSSRSSMAKVISMGTPSGCTGSSPVASANPDGSDYIVNSCTSAQTVINTAISALPSIGGTIYLMEGTYIIDGSISLPNNVTLTGSGASTVIKFKDSINANIDGIVNTDPTTGNTKISVSNLRLDGNKAGNTSGTQNGIMFTRVGNTSGNAGAKIDRIWVDNVRSNGVSLQTSSNNSSVSNSSFSSNGSGVSGSAITVSNTTNVGIHDNTIMNNVGESIWLNTGGSLNSITGNTITGSSSTSIRVSASNNTISGNVINSGALRGIWLENNGSGNTVNGNKLHDNGSTGASSSIELSGTSNNSITGNDITDTAGTGYAISLTSASSATYIANNRFSGTGAGSISDLSTTTVYGGQLSSTTAYTIQASGGISLQNNTSVNGTLSATTSLLSTLLDTPSSAPLNIGTTNATAINLNKDTSIAGNLTFDGAANRTISVGTAAASTTGRQLILSAGAGGSGTGSVGGDLVLVGGAGGGTNANGGNVTVYGGLGSGTGVRGLVNLGPASFASVTNSACAANCTIPQDFIDTYGTVVISASTPGITITLPAPTNTTAGRTIYVATSSTSQDFNLRTNTGVDVLDVAMRKNTTSTMIWNGTAWTPGGASNATTLQATYNNGSNPATTPEIKLDSVRGTIDIQDADTSIGADLLNIRGSNANGLGTVLFGVSDTGRVTIQGTTDQNSAFRVLDSNGNYQLNVNSANGYIMNNSISSIGNEISNPGFEAGGLLAGGEEGWFGPAVGNIVNNAANSRGGNYHLEIGASSTLTNVYAGTYYEVQPGDTMLLKGWVKNSAGANGTAGIQLTFYDRNKSPIATGDTDYATLPGTTYVQKLINATAPANAAYVRASAVVNAGATTGIFYFDDFVLNTTTQTGISTFRNNVDSTNAFKIQSAGSAQTLFSANTLNNRIKVGDSIGNDTNTTLLVLDSTVVDPTTNIANGGLFYRSDTNSLKAIIGGSVVDICTTAVTCNGYSASAGSSISLQAGSPGTKQIGNFNISGTGILTRLQTEDNPTGSTQDMNITTGNSNGGISGDIVINTGTATGTRGKITIGTANVGVIMGGSLKVQGANALELGANTVQASMILHGTGSSTVTIKGPSTEGSSYALTLPSNLGAAGECMKTDTTGNIYFQGCGVGVNFNLQDAYNNSGTPSNIALTDGKNFEVTATDSINDPSILFNLNCVSGCSGSNGRFAVRNGATDIFTVSPNGAGITLNGDTQIGSSATDLVQTLFHLDSYSGDGVTSGQTEATCGATTNQGALYYNTKMGSLRGCINGAWSDVSNPDTLGLLTFGIIPSSGPHPYDLPALVNNGSSGPCKVSYLNSNTVSINQCVAYSNGRRVTVGNTQLSINTATPGNTNLTSAARWGHVCLNAISGQAEFTATTGFASATAGMPDSSTTNFNAASPIVCLADVQATTAGGVIDNIYDTRTFTSAMKEAVNLSTATELGMIVDAGTSGAMTPAVSASAKLYGTVVATNGSTSAGAPNAIVTTVGPAWVKATAGTAGQFVKTSLTNGYGDTTAAIPNNSFYYSVGNTRTSYSTTCTASTNCAGSLYINFIVR